MVSVRGLSHSYGDKVVLTDINLEIAESEIVAIMGTSGGGKTTLLRCITGLLKPTKGEVEVAGVSVQADPEEARRRMGLVFQSSALFDYLDVHDNVLFGPKRWQRLGKSEQDDLVEATLSQVGLEDVEHLMPSELSGGMRKRVGIARALALKPKVMLYDEPTTGLDPITTYTIDSLIVSLRDRLRVTTLVVSHDVSSVFRVADRIAFLNAGRLAFVGSVDEFRASEDEDIRELVYKADAKDFAST
jgi:phospholipid/cholesterol/gamma-HCH transport system ATP-binding protein